MPDRKRAGRPKLTSTPMGNRYINQLERMCIRAAHQHGVDSRGSLNGMLYELAALYRLAPEGHKEYVETYMIDRIQESIGVIEGVEIQMRKMMATEQFVED